MEEVLAKLKKKSLDILWDSWKSQFMALHELEFFTGQFN
jgi:hypothetical protein